MHSCLPYHGDYNFSLRSKLEIDPGISFSSKNKAIVQAMRLSLPELDTICHNSEAAPERWTAECSSLLNRASKRANSASRNGRPEISALCGEAHALNRLRTRTPLKVSIRFAARQLLDATFSPHLALDQGPMKDERRTRVLEQLGSFAAVVVGIEDEASAAEAAMQHHPDRRGAIARRCREGHGLGQQRARSLRVAVPFLE